MPREYLSRPDTPDIASIPIQILELKEAVRKLSNKELESIANPISLSSEEQEFLEMHHRLLHLPYLIMFRLEKAGILPTNFLRLKYKPPPCASCLFGMKNRSNWRSKSSKHGK